jgi:hypothetical protein
MSITNLASPPLAGKSSNTGLYVILGLLTLGAAYYFGYYLPEQKKKELAAKK